MPPSDLETFFTLDNVEANLFRQQSTITRELGPWDGYFNFLLNRASASVRREGEKNCMNWRLDIEASDYAEEGDHRYGRKLTLDFDGEVTVIALYPKKSQFNTERPFIDYHFTVWANNTVAPTFALMMQNAIIGNRAA